MAGRMPYSSTAFTNDRASKQTRRLEDPAHLAFIRKLPSIVSGAYGCEACHIRARSAIHRKPTTGIARKPDDIWTLPLTPAEHREQHSENEIAFWRKHELDPFTAAQELYDLSGNFDAAVRYINSFRRAAL